MIYKSLHRKYSGKSLVGDRGKKKINVNGKDALSFEIWIFRNGQPVRDDDIFCVPTDVCNLGAT